VRELSESDVRERLDPARLISAIELAFRERYPTVSIPARLHMEVTDGVLLIMPCYDRRGNALGMKLVTVRRNPAHSEDRVQATFLLLDPTTSVPRLAMPANYLTALRTAATSAVATKALARDDVKSLGVFGTGREARAHLHALPLVRKFETVFVCGRDSKRASIFAEKMCQEMSIPVTAVAADDCVANSDVICTCTTSISPLFDGKLIRPGTHLNVVGAFEPHTREVDALTVLRSTVVVDTYEGTLAEAGDLLIPIRERSIDRGHIRMDLHEMLSGKIWHRGSRDEITLFKSVGCALEDLVAAELVAKKCELI